MNLDIIARLVQILRESPELGAIEVRRGFFGAWTAVRVSKAGHVGIGGGESYTERAFVAERGAPPLAPPGGGGGAPGRREPGTAPASAGAGSGSAPSAAAQLVDIKSPMVGTFYASPEPGAEPYVKVGMRVSTGQMVCIIEAMKIMNEIESEVQGVVRDIAVENGQPVEFGQTLFRVDPNG